MNEPKTVTIRLPRGALAGWPVLVDVFRRAREMTGYDMTFSDLIEQIETQTTPRPEEPTGLGAVVEDATGAQWVRVEPKNADVTPWHAPWTDRLDDPQPRDWDDIKAVRVLSEGVQP